MTRFLCIQKHLKVKFVCCKLMTMVNSVATRLVKDTKESHSPPIVVCIAGACVCGTLWENKRSLVVQFHDSSYFIFTVGLYSLYTRACVHLLKHLVLSPVRVMCSHLYTHHLLWRTSKTPVTSLSTSCCAESRAIWLSSEGSLVAL